MQQQSISAPGKARALAGSRRLALSVILAGAAAAAAPAGAQAPLFGDFGDPAWSRVYSYIESRVGTLAPDDVVLVPPVAITAAWDDRIKPLRLMEMYHWGDDIPTLAFNYNRDASRRVSTGYRYFLDSALLHSLDANGTASPALKNAVRRSSEEVEFARGEYNRVVADADSAYAAYAAATPSAQRKSKSRYFAEQGHDAQIEATHRRLTAALRTFKQISASLSDPDIDLINTAIAKYDNPAQKIYIPPAREAYDMPDVWEQKFVSLVGGDIDAFLRESSPETQEIAESQSTSSTYESRWKASVKAKFLGLFRVGGASAEQTRREEHVRNNATRISVAFKNVGTFDVVRGEWFDGNVISRFAPRLPADAHKAVFGQNGQLELLPKTLLVARGMKFTVYADSNSLDYLYDHFKGGADAGIRLGYFTIGGKGSYSVTKTETKVTKFADRIEFEDQSGRAKVIAVVAKRYGAAPLQPMIASMALPAIDASARIEALPEWTPSAVLNKALVGFPASDRRQITDR